MKIGKDGGKEERHLLLMEMCTVAAIVETIAEVP